MINKLEHFVETITFRTSQIAQATLVFTMLIIVANVLLRIPWKPIPGTVEIVEMSGAMLLATAVAYTAMVKGHITVGILVERLSKRVQGIIDLIVNAIALIFSSLLARETFIFAARMMERGYSTAHLSLPVAPSIYLVAFSFAMLALVLLLNLIKAIITVFKGSES